MASDHLDLLGRSVGHEISEEPHRVGERFLRRLEQMTCFATFRRSESWGRGFITRPVLAIS
jgi:hypothetical protein